MDYVAHLKDYIREMNAGNRRNAVDAYIAEYLCSTAAQYERR